MVLGKGFADASHNLKGVVIGTAGAANLLGKGEGVIAINNRKTKPTENHPSGGQLYVEGGALFWRGSSGSVTEIAKA